MKQYAYLYLSQIGNLGEVVYEYQVDGETKQLTVTSSEATEFAGCDIKEVGKDMNLLESLENRIFQRGDQYDRDRFKRAGREYGE